MIFIPQSFLSLIFISQSIRVLNPRILASFSVEPIYHRVQGGAIFDGGGKGEKKNPDVVSVEAAVITSFPLVITGRCRAPEGLS